MKFIKKNRSFSFIRRYGFIFTFVVALGGLFYPRLGLMVLGVMLGLVLTSFFNAKFWCGNVCPHGSYFDNIILPLSRNSKIPSIFRSKYLAYGVFSFFLLNMARKILAIRLDFPTMIFWDQLGGIFSTTYLMVVIVGGIIGIFTSPRTWCQVCPMGTMEKISYGLGKKLGFKSPLEKKVTITSLDQCKACGLCYRVCPVQIEVNTSFDNNNQISNINCIKCSTCITYCPMDILSLEKAKN